MPKVLNNMREILLEKTKQVVNEEGYTAFSMRNIATQCGIAPGTIYNYFHSKDDMIAAFVMDDWKLALKEIRLQAEKQPDIISELECLYDGVVAFCDNHKALMRDSNAISSFYKRSFEYHTQLTEELGSIINPTLEKCAVNYTPYLTRFLSENTIYCAVRGYSFERFREVIMPLFKA